MKIVILDGYTTNPGDLSFSEFERLGSLVVYDHTDSNDTAEIIKRIGDAEVVITNKTVLLGETIAACPNIKYIGTLSTGYNQVDLEYTKSLSIPVCNIPAYSTDSVAQFTFGLLLEICNQIGHHAEAVKQGRWVNSRDFCFWDYPMVELKGKTMGIIGLGLIGTATAKIANAMGMNVIAHSPREREEGKAVARYVTLDELFTTSDIVSLHCPLFPSTQGLINKNSIAQMKDGVIILNVSRGPLIVDEDLADALNSGKVYAAGLDVVSVEPILHDNPLLKAKNCIITPHIAWAARACRQRLIKAAVNNLQGFINGKLQNVVNN